MFAIEIYVRREFVKEIGVIPQRKNFNVYCLCKTQKQLRRAAVQKSRNPSDLKEHRLKINKIKKKITTSEITELLTQGSLYTR